MRTNLQFQSMTRMAVSMLVAGRQAWLVTEAESFTSCSTGRRQIERDCVWLQLWKPQSLPSVTHILQRPHLLVLPKQSTSWEPNIQLAILSQTTKGLIIVLCCVYVHGICKYVCAYACTEDVRCPALLLSALLPWDTVSHCIWSLPSQPEWQASELWGSVSPPPAPGLQGCA